MLAPAISTIKRAARRREVCFIIDLFIAIDPGKNWRQEAVKK
jgi:hypothetical protein